MEKGEGEELKVPRYGSAAATRDDTWRPLALFPTPSRLIEVSFLPLFTYAYAHAYAYVIDL